MNPGQVLREAAGLIEQIGWTQGVDARDANGEGINFALERPDSFSLQGAISYVTLSSELRPYREGAERAILNFLRRDRIGGVTMNGWNHDPDRTHAEVVAALRQAADEYDRSVA